MSKAVKQKIAQEFSKRWGGASDCVLISYKGLKSGQMTQLRSYLREADIKVNVVRNALARITFDALPKIGPAKKFIDGPTAIVYSGGKQDAVLLTKRLLAWKDPDMPKLALEIRGGCVEGRVVTAAEVKALSQMPSRQELLARLAGCLNAPASRLAYAMTELMSKLGRAINQYKPKETPEAKPEPAAPTAAPKEPAK